MRKQKCSLGLCWGTWQNPQNGVTFDIVPAFENSSSGTTPGTGTGTTYTIYRRRTGETTANPQASKELIKQINQIWDGQFCNFVKLAKKWNSLQAKFNSEEQEREKPFKSFHLEVLCYQFALQQQKEKPENMQIAMCLLFEFLFNHCTDRVKVPGVSNQYIELQANGGGWKISQVQNLLEQAFNLAKRAIQYDTNQTFVQSNQCWKEIFGQGY